MWFRVQVESIDSANPFPPSLTHKLQMLCPKSEILHPFTKRRFPETELPNCNPDVEASALCPGLNIRNDAEPETDNLYLPFLSLLSLLLGS